MPTDKNITQKEDLLGFLPDRADVGNPAQYLRVSDFETTPDTQSADYFPTAHQGVQIGSSPSRYFGGGIPIFSGGGALPPYAVADARAKAFEHATRAQQMRDQYKTDQANQNRMYYQRPDDLPIAYNEDFQNAVRDRSMQYWSEAVKYYGGNQRLAQQDLQNPNGVFGRKYNDFNQNVKTYAANVKGISGIKDNIRKLQQEDKIVVTAAMENLLGSFEKGDFGRLDEHDPTDLKKRFMELQIMNNMLPQYNAYLAKQVPSQLPQEGIGNYKAKPGYFTHAVNPIDAKQDALKTIRSGNKSAWAFLVGLPANANEEQIADKMATDAASQHEVQYTKIPSEAEGKNHGWSGGDFTNDRFAVRPTVRDAEGKMKEGSGYEVQDLTASENSFKEVWRAPYALSADTKKPDSKFSGEVQGAFTGTLIARNPETKKLQWYAIITEPSVTSTDKNTTIQGVVNKNIHSEGQPNVTPPLTHLIPYEDVAGKIEAYTADKKGNGGFKLRPEDLQRVDEMNKHLPENKSQRTYPLPEGKAASVKQNGVIYTWNTENGKYE